MAISQGDVHSCLTTEFPGCIPATIATMNGVVVSIQFWMFTLTIALTVSKVAPCDQVGLVDMVFKIQLENPTTAVRGNSRRIQTLLKSQTAQLDEMVTFIHDCASLVRGIQFTLDSALSPQTPLPSRLGLLGLLDKDP